MIFKKVFSFVTISHGDYCTTQTCKSTVNPEPCDPDFFMTTETTNQPGKNKPNARPLQLLALVLALASLLGKEVLVNVGKDTTLGDGDVAKQLVQLLVVPDGELKMTGNDTGLLVVTSGIASQLKDFRSEVLKDGSEVDGSTSTNTLSVVALPEETVDTTDREGEAGLRRSGLRVLGTAGLATRLAASGHFD